AVDPEGRLANYQLTLVAGTLTVTKAVLTVSAADQSREYGQANPKFTVSYSGFGNGESLATSGITGSPSCSTTATSASPVGSYPIVCTIGTLKSANYSFRFLDGTLVVRKATLTVTAANKSKSYGAVNPTLTVSYSGFRNGETLATSGVTGSPSCSTPATQASDVGTYPIVCAIGTLSATNYTFRFVDGTLTITQATLTVTAANKSKQYSDPLPAFTVTYSGFVLGQDPSVLSGTLSCTTAATSSSAPGTYAIACSGLFSNNYAIRYTAGTLTVTEEDARAAYTGTIFAWTSSATTTTVAVSLSTTVRDITAVTGDSAYDAAAGDVRYARVRFVNRDNGAVLCDNLQVNLVDTDPKVGTAACSWTVNVGTADSVSQTIGIVVIGYYKRNASTENAVVTVSRPLSGLTTGGGYLVKNSRRTDFGFSARYNESTAALQGGVRLIVRASGKVYQVKGGTITSLVTHPCTAATSPSNTCPSTATVSGKGSIQDITNALAPISVDTNATFQVTLTDKGEPGSTDTVGITVWNAAGTLWFSSNWDGTKTVEQVLTGGNLAVR
ncbi:MAG: hypothetical protein M3301_09530, partial [Chloroflexota bacterium]|nr:hypothetical protein [Chloroflexota bacterium]